MLDKLNQLTESHGELEAGRGHLFGTAVQSDRKWPERYGVQGDYTPNGFWSQLKFPFTWRG